VCHCQAMDPQCRVATRGHRCSGRSCAQERPTRQYPIAGAAFHCQRHCRRSGGYLAWRGREQVRHSQSRTLRAVECQKCHPDVRPVSGTMHSHVSWQTTTSLEQWVGVTRLRLIHDVRLSFGGKKNQHKCLSPNHRAAWMRRQCSHCRSHQAIPDGCLARRANVLGKRWVIPRLEETRMRQSNSLRRVVPPPLVTREGGSSLLPVFATC
jgi:hypothetical protein